MGMRRMAWRIACQMSASATSCLRAGCATVLRQVTLSDGGGQRVPTDVVALRLQRYSQRAADRVVVLHDQHQVPPRADCELTS